MSVGDNLEDIGWIILGTALVMILLKRIWNFIFLKKQISHKVNKKKIPLPVITEDFYSNLLKSENPFPIIFDSTGIYTIVNDPESDT